MALTTEFFDLIPISQMIAAEKAVKDAAQSFPQDMQQRLKSANKIADSDRSAMVETIRKALASFQPQAPAKNRKK